MPDEPIAYPAGRVPPWPHHHHPLLEEAAARTREEHALRHEAALRPDGTLEPHDICAICLELGLQGPAI